ncbi:hypothetical protein NPIL_621561 [Nephila pilipes]|uniref:Uncharacterized protein n=1 Tax=Nephila pilipes TaxID=299642 RepID=A0A8X6R5K3_NEPPI|nr:hypothetical protein NPIL_621561 [Nephila pilipes]
MYARWTSPCAIVEKRNAYSYSVQIPYNNAKHIHTNKIRKLNIQANNIGVICKTDIYFGNIEEKRTHFVETYIREHLNSSHLNPHSLSRLPATHWTNT